MARLQSLRQLLNSSLYIPCWSCLLLFFGCLPKVIPTRLLNLSLLSLLLSPFAVWGAGSQIIYLQAMRLIWYLTLFLQYLHFSSFLAYYGTGRVFSANLQRKSLQIRFFMLYLVIAPFLGDIAAGLCYDLKEARNFWWLLPDVLNMTSVSPLISWIMAYFFAVFCCYLAWVLLKGLPEAAEPSNYGGAAPSARHDNPPAT